MSKTVNTKILLRNDSASNWTTNNPTLSKGEIGVQIDTKKFKFGDGTTPWNSLDYGAGASIAAATADPLMDGTAAVGTSSKYAKEDHVHPSDTSRVPTSRTVNGHALSSDVTVTNLDLGQTYGTCTTAAATAAKTVTKSGFKLTTGGIVSILFSNDVPASATLNINSTGAKNIYYKSTAITANVIRGGEIATFIYDGTQYQLLGVDRIIKTDGNGGLQMTAGGEISLALASTTNNGAMSTTDKAKLDGIASGAEVNVQSDWNQTTTTADDYIKNKPTLATVATSGSYDDLSNKPTIPTLKNVFGKVKVDSTTIEADTTQDTLELVAGSNVTLTPDTTNDKVTIAATDTTYSVATTSANGLMSSTDKTLLNTLVNGGTNGQVWKRNSVAGDWATLSASDVGAVPTTRKVNDKALSSDITLSASDVSAMPISGGTFTGAVTLNADPSSNLQAATKQYVDTQISTSLGSSDAMVFKGTLGTGGTVTAVPTTGVVKGDTYKVITAGTWAGSSCKVGDLLIALASGSVTANTTNWAYVPSGNENETTIRYSTSSQNLTTSFQSGEITVGEAATKQVDTSISSSNLSSTKLPTTQAVYLYVKDNYTKVTASSTNGNIKIDGTETTVYTLPSAVLQSSDTLILDCGSSTTNYS